MQLTPFIIDNSAMSTFRTCPEKYNLRHEQGLTSQFTESPLNFGASIHAGLAELLRGKSLNDACVAALAEWKEQEQREGEWRTPDRVISVLTDFHASELEKFKGKVQHFPDGKPMVECAIAAPISTSEEVKALLPEAGHSGVVLAGIIDAVIEDGGRIIGCDHKTDSGHFRSPADKSPAYIDPKVWDKFKPHGAAPIYLDLAQQYMPPNMVLSGFMFNILCLQKPQKAYPNGRTLFGRHTFEWTPAELAEARSDFDKWLASLLRAKIAKQWQRNPDSCTLYNRKCMFLDLCKNPPGVRENLKSLYKVEPWDPIRARKQDVNGGIE